jgi:hypothetical protein
VVFLNLHIYSLPKLRCYFFTEKLEVLLFVDFRLSHHDVNPAGHGPWGVIYSSELVYYFENSELKHRISATTDGVIN